MRVTRSIHTPIRPALSWHETWEGPDRGLIKCWEVGRQHAIDNPELAAKCRAGELPVIGWKGGVARTLQKLTRYGALNYLAEWQGLRGDDLDIDRDQELTLVCARTGMIVTFTADLTKLANQTNGSDESGEAEHGPAPGVPEQSLFS
jgi:hypothetical protein